MTIRSFTHFVAAFAMTLVGGTVQADTMMSFDTPVTTSPTQAPGVWYTDRYAPASFSSPVSFAGDNRLQHSIRATDGANNRTGFSSPFYNTQGRKFDIPGTQRLSVDLHVPADWENSGRRMAGLWGTAFDANGDISAYPIIEFASDGSGARFQVWETAVGGWIDVGLPTGFAYDEFVTLDILLDQNSDTFTVSVGDASATVPGVGSVQIGNVILQGYNTDAGVDYDIYWDNLSALDSAAVPEPASIAVFAICLIALAAFTLRQRRMRLAVASE